MSLIDITGIEADAQKEINEEMTKKAKDALKLKLRNLATAEQTVANIKREIADLKAAIAEGSF